MHVFLRTKFNDCLIWQVAAKVAAESLCVQVRSHDTIFHSIIGSKYTSTLYQIRVPDGGLLRDFNQVVYCRGINSLVSVEIPKIGT